MHPEPTFREVVQIPSKYLNPQGHCRIGFRFHFFSSDEGEGIPLEGNKLYAEKFTVIRESFGNKGQISIKIEGESEFTKQVGDPGGIPPIRPIPGAGITPDITDPEPFNPDIQIPQSVIGDPTPTEPGNSLPTEIPLEPPTEPPMEIPTEIPVEPPVEPTEPPVEKPMEPTEPLAEPKEPPKEDDKEGEE